MKFVIGMVQPREEALGCPNCGLPGLEGTYKKGGEGL